MFSKKDVVSAPCVRCNRVELETLHKHYQASTGDFWVYKTAACNACSRCDLENRRRFWNVHPCLSRLMCCEPVSTIVQVPIPLDTVGTVTRAVQASMIASKGSDYRAHGTFISHLQLLDCDEVLKQSLCTWAPKAMIDFDQQVPGSMRLLRKGNFKKEADISMPCEDGPNETEGDDDGSDEPSLPPIPECDEEHEEGSTTRRPGGLSSATLNDLNQSPQSQEKKNRWNRSKQSKPDVFELPSTVPQQEEGSVIYTATRRQQSKAFRGLTDMLSGTDKLRDFVKSHPASIYENRQFKQGVIRELFCEFLRESKIDIQYMFGRDVANSLSNSGDQVHVFNCDVSGYDRNFIPFVRNSFEFSLWNFMVAYAGESVVKKHFDKKGFKQFCNKVCTAGFMKNSDVKYWVLRVAVDAFLDGLGDSIDSSLRLKMYHENFIMSSIYSPADIAASFEKVGIHVVTSPRELKFVCQGKTSYFVQKGGKLSLRAE